MTTRFVVLGGTGAVGRSVARHLLELGHDVTITSRDARRAASAFRSGNRQSAILGPNSA